MKIRDINPRNVNPLHGTDKGDWLTGTPEPDNIDAQGGADTVFGGGGGDFINLGYDDDRDLTWYSNFSERMDIIEDFDPNDEDVVVITSGFFWDLFHNEGLNSDANVGDWLTIEQLGSDTYIRVDPDGIQGYTPFRTLAILKNVDKNDINLDIVDGDFIIA
ncbi:hypothetical protein BJP34_27690 [Moorena producens PAL-8-15-08-1]|uniref:Peptidase M10 serralysin C-terminal domain-containing protein n=1 Tax=Moorena producens PAL-8-15-08-1 TaxID=1458985 RepID=A0A1D8TYJ2_9CYAN|nr:MULTISPECIES: hypothetical protein [Moorena]AOX02721.1 hypothetical protein BJP34_27690 [Moorena producens PAL-8-15-08-1]NEO76541.1 hypothetical protein [Moorena sp. SIO4G3]